LSQLLGLPDKGDAVVGGPEFITGGMMVFLLFALIVDRRPADAGLKP